MKSGGKLRDEGYAPFFQQLVDWRTPLRGGRRKSADALIGYVVPRQEMIATTRVRRKAGTWAAARWNRCAG